MSVAIMGWALASAIAVQPPGEFHGDEVTAKDGERWLALQVAQDGTASLQQATLHVSAIEDAILDAPGQRTGRRVESANAEEVRLYLRGTGLRAGRVETGKVGTGPEGAVFTRFIQWKGRTLSLQSRCETAAPTDAGDPKVACRVELVDGDRRQTLTTMDGYRDGNGRWVLGDDAEPQLIFAGDLDRDGRLDLIIDTSNHYNMQRPTLFLSSRATGSAIVDVAGQHVSVGC